MDRKSTNIKERILQLAKNKGVSYESFLATVDLKYANFKGVQKESGINSNSIERILSEYPEVDSGWLITGSGNWKKSATYLLDETSPEYGIEKMVEDKFSSLPIDEKLGIVFKMLKNITENQDTLANGIDKLLEDN